MNAPLDPWGAGSVSRRNGTRGSLLAIALSIVVAGQVLAASTVPFTWTLQFHNPYYGRDMVSNTGTFCEWYHSTDATYNNPKNYSGSAELNTFITLDDYGGDSGREKVGITVSYRNDGAQRVYCWRGFIPGHVYFFEFEKSNYADGVWIYAAGNVQDH